LAAAVARCTMRVKSYCASIRPVQTGRRSAGGGAVTAADGAQWLAELHELAQAGSFFTSMTNFIVSGRKG
jgi:hypothetical protein